MSKKTAAKKPKKNLNFLIKISFLIFVLSISLVNLIKYFETPKTLKLEESSVLGESTINPNEAKIDYWIHFINQHQNYLPGYIELAKAYKLDGQKDKAIDILEKALAISPNSTEVKSLMSEYKD